MLLLCHILPVTWRWQRAMSHETNKQRIKHDKATAWNQFSYFFVLCSLYFLLELIRHRSDFFAVYFEKVSFSTLYFFAFRHNSNCFSMMITETKICFHLNVPHSEITTWQQHVIIGKDFRCDEQQRLQMPDRFFDNNYQSILLHLIDYEAQSWVRHLSFFLRRACVQIWLINFFHRISGTIYFNTSSEAR